MMILAFFEHFLKKIVSIKSQFFHFFKTDKLFIIFRVVNKFQPVVQVLHLTWDTYLSIFDDRISLHLVYNLFHLVSCLSRKGLHQKFQMADLFLIAPEFISYFFYLIDSKDRILVIVEDGMGNCIVFR